MECKQHADTLHDDTPVHMQTFAHAHMRAKQTCCNLHVPVHQTAAQHGGGTHRCTVSMPTNRETLKLAKKQDSRCSRPAGMHA